MAIQPTLSICVPSRNRQFYFQSAIRALTRSLRTDVEFVLVDNSDDPAIMDDFMRPLLGDPRIRYLRSGDATRSMMDNWEAAMAASTGRWVTFIGDDDHCDPEAAGVIARIEAENPAVEAIDWAKLFYTWPDGDRPPVSQQITLHTEIHEVSKSLLEARAFRWQDASHVLCSGFSIYHGAVSRRLVDRIKARYGGRFFEFPIVDYEALFKIVMHGSSFVHCRRPLSILGACPLSNSAAVRDMAEMKKRVDIFNKESGTPLDLMACYKDYPFKSTMGVIAAIGMAHHWFSERTGQTFSGFEENFVRACTAQCGVIPDREEFDLITAAYRSALARWKGGRYLKLFKPTFRPAGAEGKFLGLWDQSLYLDAGNPWCRTVADYYDFVSDLLVPVAELKVDLGQYQAISHLDSKAVSGRP